MNMQSSDDVKNSFSILQKRAKRLLDVIGSTILILFLCPVLLIIPLIIKFDSKGPAIFRQQRTGLNEKNFIIFKFRTMIVYDEDHIVQASQGDLRVTRVGKFLRKFSIDELPQLLNVLKGEMSLVGPRPHTIFHDKIYRISISDYCFRHHVKPGITGWAQISGLRGETKSIEDMADRVKFDLWYIKNWSFKLDLIILIRTVKEVMFHNAY